ncbi:WD domain, G-beta repeat protein [Trichuris suis]|nr:WD domain, G-beta repeat protein [Trichuris suis]
MPNWPLAPTQCLILSRAALGNILAKSPSVDRRSFVQQILKTAFQNVSGKSSRSSDEARSHFELQAKRTDGNYCLTSGGDKTIKLWNPHRDNCGLLLKTYSGHGYEVLDARSSHDNAQIASCGTDKQVLLWDVETGRILRKFRGHAGCVNAIAFNKDSSVVISGSLDGTVRAWDAKGRGQHPIQVMDEASDSVTSVSCSAHEILTGSADYHVRRYDLRQGMFYSDYLGKTVSSVNFSKDGQCVLASCLDSTVRLMEKGKGQLLTESVLCIFSRHTFTGHTNVEYKTDSSFFNSDRQVVSGSEDGKVYCWNLLGKEVLYTLNHPVPFVIASVSVHPEIECLLSACRGNAYLWKNVDALAS